MRCPAVAINGSFFQPWHAKIIRKIANDGVILFMDDDNAGNETAHGGTSTPRGSGGQASLSC
jgi:DNA primase